MPKTTKKAQKPKKTTNKIYLADDKMNESELTIIKFARRRKSTWKTSDMVALFGDGKDASIQVQNALRRLLRSGHIEKVERATFKNGTPATAKTKGATEARKGSAHSEKVAKSPKKTKTSKKQAKTSPKKTAAAKKTAPKNGVAAGTRAAPANP